MVEEGSPRRAVIEPREHLSRVPVSRERVEVVPDRDPIGSQIREEESKVEAREKKDYLKFLKRQNNPVRRVLHRRESMPPAGLRRYIEPRDKSPHKVIRGRIDRLSKAVGKLESDPIGNNWDSGMSGLGGSTFKLKEYNFGDVQKHFNSLNVDSGFPFDDPFDSKSYRRKKYKRRKYGKKSKSSKGKKYFKGKKYSKKNYRRRRR